VKTFVISKDVNMKARIREIFYLLYRYLKAFLGGCLYYLCRLFPVKRRKVIFSSFSGMQGYSCNPKYIAEELLRRNSKRPLSSKYELVWLVDDLSKSFPEGILKKKNNLFNRAFHLTTSRVWIDNHRKPLETRKRKNHLYINTWHGAIGFKAVGKLRGSALPRIAYIVSKHDSKMVDYFLSNSEWNENIIRQAFFYNGKIIKTGSPRCDILINKAKEHRDRIHTEYGLPMEANILLLAPTFRSGDQRISMNADKQEINISFDRLIEVLEKRFGGQWYIFLRLHPLISSKLDRSPIGIQHSRVVDVSLRDDIYDLLAIVDAFISDYSSMTFDAAIMKIPVFIYSEDKNDYEAKRGKLLWQADEIPFMTAYDSNELLDNILAFDMDKYEKALHEFFMKVGLKEDGCASKRVADLIDNYVFGEGKNTSGKEASISHF